MSFRLLAALLALAAILPGAERLSGIAARGRLVVAQYTGERFPFFYTSGAEGTLLGHDVELARELARALGVELELRRTATTFDEVVAMVARGEADLGLSKLSATLERARRVRFSRPYLVQNEALLVNRLLGARHGQDLSAACRAPGAHVGVVRGTSFEASLHEVLPGAVAEPFDRPEELLAAVVRGGLLAAYHDEVVFACLLRLRPQTSLWAGLVTLPARQDRLAIALPGDDPQFAAWVDLFIELRCRPPAVGELLDRWMPLADAVRPPVLAGFERVVDAAQVRAGEAAAKPPRSFATITLAVALMLVLGCGWGAWRLAIKGGAA